MSTNRVVNKENPLMTVMCSSIPISCVPHPRCPNSRRYAMPIDDAILKQKKIVSRQSRPVWDMPILTFQMPHKKRRLEYPRSCR